MRNHYAPSLVNGLVSFAVFLGYLFGAPITIYVMDLGPIAWLVYASTMAIVSVASLHHASMRMAIDVPR